MNTCACLARILAIAAMILPVHGVAMDSSSDYVVARDGHFYIGDQRVRFWGVNLQSGVFPNYIAMRHLVVRLSKLGFNAVRVWPTIGTFYSAESASQKSFTNAISGDGSDLDRFDFLLGQLFQRGIYVQMTALHYVDIPTIKRWPEKDVREVLGQNPSDAYVRKLHGIAPYLLSGWESMLATHIRNFLSHRNPYTGRTYADEPGVAGWELANESQFIHCLVDRECVDSLPSALKDRLQTLWREFQQQEGIAENGALPIYDQDWDRSVPNISHERYRKFLFSRFVSVSKRLEKIARSMGGSSSGIRHQPFCYSTQAGAPLLLSRAAYGAGDYSALGAYQTSMTEDRNAPFYPYALHLSDKSYFYNFNYGAIAGKPTTVYETSFFRPYPYRAEWPWAMLNLAMQQDWDSAFLYIYGQPKVIYEEKDGVPGYGYRALPEPGGTGPNAKELTFGLHHGGDEIAMGSWASAGEVFLSQPLVDQGRKTSIFQFSVAQVFGPAPGYCKDGPCKKPAEIMTSDMNRASLEGKVRLDLSALGNEFSKKSESPRSTVNPDNVMALFPRRHGSQQMQLDMPMTAAIVGKLEGSVEFMSKVRMHFPKPTFGFVSLQSADKQPLNKSNKLILSVGGVSSNSGFAIDSEKASKGRTVGGMAGVISPGSAPIKHERLNMEISLPRSQWKVVRKDFNFVSYDTREVQGNTISVSAIEPLFRAELTREH